MKVGDLYLINDLCANSALVGEVATVIETDIKEEWHSWTLVSLMTSQGFIIFRADTPILEAVS